MDDAFQTFVREVDPNAFGTLAKQLGALLTVAAVLLVLRHGRLALDHLPLAAATVSLALLGALFVPTLIAAARDMRDHGRSNTDKVEPEKSQACAPQSLLDVEFVEDIKQVLPPRAKYHLVVSEKFEAIATHFCMRYLLLPRVEARDFADADWALFWEETPEDELERVQARAERFFYFEGSNERDRLVVKLRDDDAR